MNHVKTYPGEETSRVQNQTVVGPDCVILAHFSFIKFGNGSCTVRRFACSHHDTVFQVQQLFRLLSGKKFKSQESGQLVVFDGERPH